MASFQLGLVFLHCIVFFQLSFCTSQDESTNLAVTAGKHLHMPSEASTPENDIELDEHSLENGDDYNYEEYEDEYPRVAFSTRPKMSSLTAMKARGKGRARKKNPCLRKKYANYCINGVCQYLAELNRTSCICKAGYSGERCHLFILPVGKEIEGSNHTTTLAVMAVILSLMCLTVIGILITIRCHKKGDSSGEKISLQPLHSSEEKAKDTNQTLIGHDTYHLETSCQR